MPIARRGGLYVCAWHSALPSQVRILALLEVSEEVHSTGYSREDICDWVGKTLREPDYVVADHLGHISRLDRQFGCRRIGFGRPDLLRLGQKKTAPLGGRCGFYGLRMAGYAWRFFNSWSMASMKSSVER